MMEIAYLKMQADDALACARRLAEKAQADGRHLSYAEQMAFDRKMADTRRFAEQIKQHRGNEATVDEDHDPLQRGDPLGRARCTGTTVA